MTSTLDDARGELLATIAKIDHLLEREEHDSGYAAFVYMRKLWPQLKQLAAPVPQCDAEPVGWISWFDGNCDATARKDRAEDWRRRGRKVEPLYATPPSRSDAETVERCAKIAQPWAGFWLDDNSTDADRAVVEVRTEIAAKIRALALSSAEGNTP